MHPNISVYTGPDTREVEITGYLNRGDSGRSCNRETEFVGLLRKGHCGMKPNHAAFRNKIS